MNDYRNIRYDSPRDGLGAALFFGMLTLLGAIMAGMAIDPALAFFLIVLLYSVWAGLSIRPFFVSRNRGGWKADPNRAQKERLSRNHIAAEFSRTNRPGPYRGFEE